jgi:hypothetical protein
MKLFKDMKKLLENHLIGVMLLEDLEMLQNLLLIQQKQTLNGDGKLNLLLKICAEILLISSIRD